MWCSRYVFRLVGPYGLGCSTSEFTLCCNFLAATNSKSFRLGYQQLLLFVSEHYGRGVITLVRTSLFPTLAPRPCLFNHAHRRDPALLPRLNSDLRFFVSVFRFQSEDADFEVDEVQTYAELWMGTHPNGPSRVVRDGHEGSDELQG